MADVFVSYKREDATKVRKLVGVLRSVGLDVWWDEDIPASAPWEATIEKALREARAVIVCWSPESVASENVRSEARVARADGRLIQVFLAPCEPPLFFGERQGVDLSKWRGAADDPRIASLAETARKLAAGERMEDAAPRSPRKRFNPRAVAAVAILFLVVAAGTGWWLLRSAASTGPQTLAVLPFRTSNAADADLVDAIWDDTRGAIGRNPNLRVLGRETIEALAGKHLEPAAYRSRTGADYLLDGTVEHVGDQVQMNLSLVRTRDGAEVWSDQLGGKLDDVFAFQQRIASAVEGRIRGRLAPGGGRVAKAIATTGQVYSLYAQATARIRERSGIRKSAIPLLRKAVAIDPNYAPAWTELAEATKLSPAEGETAEDVRRESRHYLERSLALAPNLAKTHAVLGSLYGTAPEAEMQYRRALALDPNDVEAWMWLGNFLVTQNKVQQALEAHSRAVELDPLWWDSMYNKMDDLGRLIDMEGLSAELRRAQATGDERLALLAREHVASITGHPGTEARIWAEFRHKFPDEPHSRDLAATLLQLGYAEEAAKLLEWPAAVTAAYQGNPPSAQWLRSELKPLDFWQSADEIDEPALVLARLLPKQGRLREYVGYYKAAFSTPDEFRNAVDWPGDGFRFMRVAPNAAANLRSAAMASDAAAIVQQDESIIEPLLRNGPADKALLVDLAQLRGAEGRDNEAVALLGRAVARGWLPDGAHYSADIADEPCFARLTNRADFQALRRKLFARLDGERRAAGPVEQLLQPD